MFKLLEKRKTRGMFLLLVALLVGVLTLGPTLVAFAQMWFDDFNRADGPIGGNWTVHDGAVSIQSQQIDKLPISRRYLPSNQKQV